MNFLLSQQHTKAKKDRWPSEQATLINLSSFGADRYRSREAFAAQRTDVINQQIQTLVLIYTERFVLSALQDNDALPLS